jgi:lysophospholipase L1-like esterase
LIPFVQSYIYDGLNVTKDSVNANQVNVTGGRVYFSNRPDDVVLFDPASFTTSTPNATYYLNIYPDGKMTFDTVNVNKTGYINVATVTTDSSGNVSTVTINQQKYPDIDGLNIQTQAARAGYKWIALGDSITQGSSDVPHNILGNEYFAQTALKSQGRLIPLRNAGISGNTSAMMLARIQTDVVAYQPDICTILAGTNDITQNVPPTTIRSNIEQMVQILLANGILPVLMTVCPRQDNDAYLPAVSQTNILIRDLADKYGIPCLDIHSVLVDPTTGHYLSGYCASDGLGIHPSRQGHDAISNYMANAFNQWLYPRSPLLPKQNVNGVNLVQNPLMLSTISMVQTAWAPNTAYTVGTYVQNGGNVYKCTTAGTSASSGGPSGTGTSITDGTAVWSYVMPNNNVPSTGWYYWGSQGAGVYKNPAVVTSVQSGDTNILGNWVVISATSNAGGNQYMNQDITTGFNPGDKVAFVGRVYADCEAGSFVVGISLSFYNASGQSIGGLTPLGSNWGADIKIPGGGVWYMEGIVPAGTTKMTVYITAGNGTGTLKVAQVGVYNLTQIGLT